MFYYFDKYIKDVNVSRSIVKIDKYATTHSHGGNPLPKVLDNRNPDGSYYLDFQMNLEFPRKNEKPKIWRVTNASGEIILCSKVPLIYNSISDTEDGSDAMELYKEKVGQEFELFPNKGARQLITLVQKYTTKSGATDLCAVVVSNQGVVFHEESMCYEFGMDRVVSLRPLPNSDGLHIIEYIDTIASEEEIEALGDKTDRRKIDTPMYCIADKSFMPLAKGFALMTAPGEWGWKPRPDGWTFRFFTKSETNPKLNIDFRRLIKKPVSADEIRKWFPQDLTDELEAYKESLQNLKSAEIQAQL